MRDFPLCSTVSWRFPQLVFLAALWCVWLTPGLPGMADMAWALKRMPAELVSVVHAHGRARVLVGLEVEGYAELARTSAAWRPDSGRTRGGDFPDERLRRAVSAAAAELDALADGQELLIRRRYGYVPALAVEVTALGLERLAASPRVRSIRLDGLNRAVESASIEKESSTRLPQSTPQIGATEAWARGYDGRGWYVAILDTGVLTSHEMFQGKNIVEACFSTTGCSDGDCSTTLCPNGQAEMFGAGAAAPGGVWHGTHCAGIAVGDNQDPDENEPTAGVAPGADLIAIQVFSNFNGEYYAWDGDIIAGLDYVYGIRGTHRVAACNLSLGSDALYSSACDSTVPEATQIVEALHAAGVATTVATGNSYSCSSISWPACIEKAVAVGAATKMDTFANMSNWHPTLQDLFAPGISINSAMSYGVESYAAKGGTSMAAPHAAGAFAVLKQASQGQAGVEDVLAALRGSDVSIYACSGWIPRLDVGGAVDEVEVPVADVLRYLPAILAGSRGAPQP